MIKKFECTILFKFKILRVVVFHIILSTTLFTDNKSSFGDVISSSFYSVGDSIEFGVDLPIFSSLKFQDDFIADKYNRDFQESIASIPSIYLSLKSKSYLTPIDIGIYFNSTFRYSNFSKQRPMFNNGYVYDKEVDIETSINYLSLNITPSIFYFINIGTSKLVFELFSGVGVSTYLGNYKEFLYPTADEYNSTVDKTIFQVSSGGEVTYIGEDEDLGFGYGVNFMYGAKAKFIYQNFNIHFIYQAPFVITTGEYLNINQILVGVGYTF